MTTRRTGTPSSDARTLRLEAELRANLKKRKDQARAREARREDSSEVAQSAGLPAGRTEISQTTDD